MRNAIELYLRYISMQARSQMQYRLSFFMDIFSTAVLNGFPLLGVALLVSRFGAIQGWSVGEIAFLAGMAEMSFALMDLIFSGFDPDAFSIMVRLGTFDQLLLRPVPMTLQVLGSRFVMRRLGRFLGGVVIFLIALTLADVHWTALKLIYIPVVLASLVLAFGSLFMAGGTLIFWTVQPIEAINILTYGGNEMITYPMTIYPTWLRRIFTYVIPFMLINFYPALFFLDKPDPFHMPAWMPFLAPLASALMFVVALLFWRFGIRHYHSTGS